MTDPSPLVALLAALMIAAPANAQPFLGFTPAHADRAATGDPDLDRAVRICDAHRVPSNTMIATVPPQNAPAWGAGYEACSQVEGRWEATEVARRQREQAAQDVKDRDFLSAFLGKKP